MDEPIDVKSEADKLILACQFLAELRLSDLREVITTADTIGPIIDPTAYRDMLYRDGNMHDVRALIDKALPLVQEFEQLRERFHKMEPTISERLRREGLV